MAAETRVSELEKRLNSTGETSEQSLAAIQDRLKTTGSEMAKLWDGQSQLKSKMTAALEENIASSNKQLQAALREMEGKSKQPIADVQAELKVLQDLVQAQQSSSNKDDESRKELAAKIGDVSKKLKAMESDLSQRVRNAENAIESIDAFRLQVNREINKLKGGQWTRYSIQIKPSFLNLEIAISADCKISIYATYFLASFLVMGLALAYSSKHTGLRIGARYSGPRALEPTYLLYLSN